MKQIFKFWFARGWAQLRSVAYAVAIAALAAFSPASAAVGWAGLNGTWRKQGITPDLLYDGVTISNLVGGAHRGTVYVGNLHLQLRLDGARLFDEPGLTIFLDTLDVHGGDPEAYVGDAQVLSNLAASPQFVPYEGWIQYNTRGSTVSILAGQYDLNSEFDRSVSAGLFLNSSFGIDPAFSSSGVDGPSIFPHPSLGIRLAVKPARNIVWRTAILDGRPVERPPGSPGLFSASDGLLLVSEFALLTRPGAIPPPGRGRSLIGRASTLPPYEDKLAIGGWYYTARFGDLSQVGAGGLPRRHRGSAGVYLDADVLLHRGTGGGEVYGFLQLAYGDNRVNRFGSYMGIGLMGQGLIPGRPDDEIGLAAGIARNGTHFLTAAARAGMPNDKAETAIELTYLAQLTDWFALQPDVQYILDPGTDPRQTNALAFQFEFEVSL